MIVLRLVRTTTPLGVACLLATVACSSPGRGVSPSTDAGMAGAAGGGAGGGGGTGLVTCNITTLSAELSGVIPTVGIVTWSTDLVGLDAARIEFGLDSSYGMTASVDLTEPQLRTLLVGMKTSSEYHYRIVASAAGQECVAADATLTTGPPPNGFGLPDVNTPNPGAVAPGFIVTSQWQDGMVFILDSLGDLVWWYDVGGDVSRALMSYDAKHIWFGSVNVRGGDPRIGRVSIDGLDEQPEFPEFGEIHHDFTLLPDETVAFIQHGEGQVDQVMERSLNGNVRQVTQLPHAHGGTTNNHGNSLHYHAADDSYTVSDLRQNCYAKVARSGQKIWVLGGDEVSGFFGDGADWNRQHGHHLLSGTRLLFFNNRGAGGAMGGSAESSLAVEVELDLDNMTATRVWSYDGGESSNVLGDVQRLPNGNTLVTYSASGVVHEVAPDGSLVQELAWPIGGATGYSTWRATLYGPPPR